MFTCKYCKQRHPAFRLTGQTVNDTVARKCLIWKEWACYLSEEENEDKLYNKWKYHAITEHKRRHSGYKYNDPAPCMHCGRKFGCECISDGREWMWTQGGYEVISDYAT